jgi:hypothetical protein
VLKEELKESFCEQLKRESKKLDFNAFIFLYLALIYRRVVFGVTNKNTGILAG